MVLNEYFRALILTQREMNIYQRPFYPLLFRHWSGLGVKNQYKPGSNTLPRNPRVSPIFGAGMS